MTAHAHAGELMAGVLWPPEAEPSFGPAGELAAGRRQVGKFRVRPDLERATAFVPAGRAGAVTLRRLAAQNSQLARLARLAAIPAAWAGALMHLPGSTVSLTVSSSADPSTSLLAELGRRLGTEVATVVYLGPPRPNRKPVPQLVDRRGRAVAWAKIAPNDLTRRLVDTEAGALDLIEGQRSSSVLRAARVLDRFEWLGSSVLLFEPLPPAWLRARAGGVAQVDAAITEIAGLVPMSTSTLSGSAWSASIAERLALAGADGAAASWDELVTSSTQELVFGAWHGDFTSWNHDVRGDRVNVWDWERFGRCVPLGFDLTHLVFQERLQHENASVADSTVATAAPEVGERLRRLGVIAGTEELVLTCYLFELRSRYGEDRAMAGARYDTWCAALDEVLADRLGRLAAPRRRADGARSGTAPPEQGPTE